MNRKVVVNKKLLRQKQKEEITGTRWKEKDDFIIRIYELYKKNRITAEHLMDIFPGRSFHAINNKVYNIKGKRGFNRKQDLNPNQLELPLGGLIECSKSKKL